MDNESPFLEEIVGYLRNGSPQREGFSDEDIRELLAVRGDESELNLHECILRAEEEHSFEDMQDIRKTIYMLFDDHSDDNC